MGSPWLCGRACQFRRCAAGPQVPPAIRMKMRKPDVWAALGGAGGNSMIINGKTGVIVVDAQQMEAGAKDLLAH